MTISSTPVSAEQRPPRQSATVVVVRAGTAGNTEVLLLRRAERGDQNSGAWVFPGGLTDPRDREAHEHADGLDDAAASQRLKLPSGGLDFYLAAARECFEESGLLMATTPLPPADVLAPWRSALQRGEAALGDFCKTTGLRLALADFAYLSHWLTPVGRPKRFDTRFFLAVAPSEQTVVHDGSETIDHVWITPAEALARGEALRMLTPTLHTLRLLASHPTLDSLLAWARQPREIEMILPCLGVDSRGQRPVTPDEPAYAEVARLDPQRSGNAWCELVPGRAVRLSERLIRVTANNGSMMTGPGTNTYLVGAAAGDASGGDWAVIDPGPADAAHVDAVLAAAPGPIRFIFVTHTHMDHSPATALLRERTGAIVHGRIADHPQWQDRDFTPDVALHGGERFVIGSGAGATTLTVIHTPGHASNHLCYLLEEEKTLLTGDHVMQSSTVVINPPDGDMAAYVASLRRLVDELDLEWIAPGHGFLMDKPRAAMQAIIEHRLKREAKVYDAVAALGPATGEVLLARVYSDVPQRLHAMAMRSLTAHLLKLEHDGRCRRVDTRWAVVD
ncbi:MBL fold metallo-hydrolase [Piscinibacter sakaiensis]|uniref:MBL fold metallo-hydrolase n=1 Tax=Piscinibacter sakaiensis TaxID=1547922 RepID=UPI003AAE8651